MAVDWNFQSVITTALAFVTLISVCVGGANMLFDIKRDVTANRNTITSHITGDEEMWTATHTEINGNKDKIHLLEVASARRDTQMEMVIEKLDTVDEKIDGLYNIKK